MAGVALSCEQRDEIASCLGGDELMSWVAVAARVGVDRTTVAREVVRNGGRIGDSWCMAMNVNDPKSDPDRADPQIPVPWRRGEVGARSLQWIQWVRWGSVLTTRFPSGGRRAREAPLGSCRGPV